MSDRFGDADAWSKGNLVWAKTVVCEPETRPWRGQIAAVVAGAGDAKGLGEAAGSSRELAKIADTAQNDAPCLRHFWDAYERLEGADQNASGFAFGLTRDVQAVMIAVDEVDVGMTGRPEEHGVAGGIASGGVGSGVVFAEISFDFDNAA